MGERKGIRGHVVWPSFCTKIVGGIILSAIDELIQRMKTGAVATVSQFKLRNEAIQNKVRLARIERLKREVKKRSKMIVVLEIAVPFNPFTGQEDDKYNSENKYRPLMSATQSSLVLKTLAHSDADVKTAFMARANVEEWDTSALEQLTEEDKKVFRLYRFPRVFTIPVVTINEQRITGLSFGKDYTISVERDPITGEIIGEYPIALKANKFYSDLAFEEMNHINACIELARDNKPYELKSKMKEVQAFHLSGTLGAIIDEDLKKIRQAVYNKIPVSSDRPSNYTIIYELGLENDLSIKDAAGLATLAPEELEKMARIARMTKELTEAFTKFKDGTYSRQDKHYDIWEIDMICPSSVSDSSNAMEIGKETRYEAPQVRLWEEPFYIKFYETLLKCLDNTGDLEQRFLYSARVSKLDESVERKILDVVDQNNELETNIFVTKKLIESNAEFISMAYGDAGDLFVTEATLGMRDVEDGTLDAEAAQKAGKEQQNIADLIAGGGSDDSSDEEEATSESSDKPAGDAVGADVITLS
jgi:hypothetical protein